MFRSLENIAKCELREQQAMQRITEPDENFVFGNLTAVAVFTAQSPTKASMVNLMRLTMDRQRTYNVNSIRIDELEMTAPFLFIYGTTVRENPDKTMFEIVKLIEQKWVDLLRQSLRSGYNGDGRYEIKLDMNESEANTSANPSADEVSDQTGGEPAAKRRKLTDEEGVATQTLPMEPNDVWVTKNLRLKIIGNRYKTYIAEDVLMQTLKLDGSQFKTTHQIELENMVELARTLETLKECAKTPYRTVYNLATMVNTVRMAQVVGNEERPSTSSG